ncbi:MAG TPA: STAS domain-containing protein [Rugosimonospora sp.]
MLQIDVIPADGSDVTVLVRGELDMTGAARLRETFTSLLNSGTARTVGLDLRGLTFIDSTGIGTLVVARRICTQVGVRLHLIAVSPFAARVLSVTGVMEALAGQQQ